MVTGSPECAVALIAQLCAQGLTDIVLAPGSRSAPLALAAHRAARDHRVRLHVRTDERCAGFLALGLAKPDGRPVAIVTTSGTAVGNLMPAVMEAHHAGVPLVVLSADRPAALVGFGANQTTHQAGLFSGFVRYAARLSSGAPPASWTAQAARAYTSAAGLGTRDPGPVHLNVELAEPLVGTADPPWPASAAVRQHPVGAGEPRRVCADKRTLLVCGDAPARVGRDVAALAATARLPLVAEPSSNARRGPAALRTGRLLLAGAIAGEVERVVVFGHPTLSRPVNRLLSRSDLEIVVVSSTADWVDPGWRASAFASAVDLETDPTDWLERWRAADSARGEQVDAVIAAQSALTGPAVAAAVLAAVGGGTLVLGNSQPIRDADLGAIPSGDSPRVFANRGLAGIDGTVSTAVGIALATGVPATLLCGDLTFVHDAAGLAAGLGEPRPDLRVVVADDGGGSIFATLEYGDERFADAFERVFATPSGLDVSALAGAYGVPATRVSTLPALTAALAAPLSGLEVVVAEVDRTGRRALNASL